MKPPKRIAVLSPQNLEQTEEDFQNMDPESLKIKTYFGGQEILKGVCRFARTHDDWNVYYSENVPSSFERYIQHAKPQGIIAGITTPEFRQILERSGATVVNYGNDIADPGFPSVYEDNVAIGRMAANHLLEKGLRRAVYVGIPGDTYSELRWKGFSERFQAKGAMPVCYPPANVKRANFRFSLQNEAFCNWLRSLVKPLGIYTCHDGAAFNIAATCRGLGIRVPEEIALLGTGDSSIACELSRPPLSSISYSIEQTGFEAAKLLHKLMNGKPAPTAPKLLPPQGVVHRRSSDIFAVEDQDLLLAIKLIHEHALSPLGIDEIFAKLPVSRRYVEMKFRKTLNKSPLEELLRVRIDHVKHMLTETDQTLSQIAQATGFNNNNRLSLVFKQRVSITPGEYRRQSRQNQNEMFSEVEAESSAPLAAAEHQPDASSQ